MALLSIHTWITAPPSDVWPILADLEHQASWMVDVRKLEVVTAEKQGVGAIMHVTSELFGRPVVRDVMEITRWEPPRRMDVVHRGQFHGTGSFQLEAIDPGTKLTWVEDFQPPLGPIGEIAFEAIIRPHLRRVFARSLANVRRLAESAAARQDRPSV